MILHSEISVCSDDIKGKSCTRKYKWQEHILWMESKMGT